MEYHQNIAHNHQQQQQMYGYAPQHTSSGLSLPDAPTSSEKALMWSTTTYMSESGYSTQAPSISSIDAFLNNEQMDSTMQHMDNASTISAATSHTQVNQTQQQLPQQQMAPLPPPASQVAQYTQLQPAVQPPQQQQQQQSAECKPEAQQAPAEVDNENAIADWINYQDNSEMAMKAIPELLKLLVDEDLVVVQQAAVLLNQMSRMEVPRKGLIQYGTAVHCLVDCLNTTADLETAKSLVGALYGISIQKSTGVQAIVNSKALQPLIKMLLAPTETIVSYAITTLHNVLLDCGDKVKMHIRKMGAVHQMIPLLTANNNVKFLSIVVDCLQLLAFGNQESKQAILEMGGTPLLVGILATHGADYHKLAFNCIRLLKVLSVCSQNKQALVAANVMSVLAGHLRPPQHAATAHTDTLSNALITLRNLSDAATKLNGLETLIQNLVQLLGASSDLTTSTLAACIVSNLTCNNESNKKAAMRANGIQILLKIVHQNLPPAIHNPQLVEPCLCSLRHITNRQSEMLLAHEQIRTLNGIKIVSDYMSILPRSWACTKALLGLVRNLCTNQLNSAHLRSSALIEKLMQVLFEAFTECQARTNNGLSVQPNASVVVKVEDMNLLDIVDACASALLILAKEHQNQILMKELDCITFFVQMFFSPIVNNQKAASSLLAELACNPVCAHVIDTTPGLHQFVLAHFCNQYGNLKSIAELPSGVNANASVILQHVTTLMQRVQEHKYIHQRQQQQQQQQQMSTQEQQFVYQQQQQQQAAFYHANMYTPAQPQMPPQGQYQTQQPFY